MSLLCGYWTMTCRSLSCCCLFFLLIMSILISSQMKKEKNVTFPITPIIYQLLAVSSQKALWSSAEWKPERRPELALYTGLNQSGSWRTQVHLSQMSKCRAQLWGQKHFTCMWCKITRASMPSPSCLGFCSWPRDRCDTSRGQSVPLCLHHEAETLTAVGSRCSEDTGKSL